MSPKKSEKKDTVSILWSERAKSDLGAIGDFIALDSPVAAARWVKKLVDAVDSAAMMPLSGRMVPEFQRTDLREMLRGNYRIVYRARKDRIEVLTIFEGHRLFPVDYSDESKGEDS